MAFRGSAVIKCLPRHHSKSSNAFISILVAVSRCLPRLAMISERTRVAAISGRRSPWLALLTARAD